MKIRERAARRSASILLDRALGSLRERLGSVPPGCSSQPRSSPSIPAGLRVYAVGDVHGRLDLLEEIFETIVADDLQRVPVRTEVVLLGDMIDRGANSAGVLSLLRGMQRRLPGLMLLKGNHEEWMVSALDGHIDALTAWLKFGGRETLLSFGMPETLVDRAVPREIIKASKEYVAADLLEWLDNLPLTHRVGDYLFVHAGIRPGVSLKRQRDEDFLWIRDDFLNIDRADGLCVVHGHTEVESVEIGASRIGLDTGAYRTGRLSAAGFEGTKTWVVSTGLELFDQGS